MPLAGLTFSSIFPGPTHPGGVGTVVQPLTWIPDSRRKYLGHAGKLERHEYVWGDRMSMLVSAFMYIMDPNTVEVAAITSESDDAAWERLKLTRQQPTVHYSTKSTVWPHGPRVWAVSIASASLSYWGASEGQWCVSRQITGGRMEFLEDVSSSPGSGLKAKWSKHRATHARSMAMFQLQQLIAGDEQFCCRAVEAKRTQA